jgi:hypothetical protein
VPGSRCTLRCYFWENAETEPPVEGDLLVTARGSCYRIEQVREGRPDSKVQYVLGVTRLGLDAVGVGDPGVHLWRWMDRAPAEAGRRG